jgi:hypothetical protein
VEVGFRVVLQVRQGIFGYEREETALRAKYRQQLLVIWHNFGETSIGSQFPALNGV